MSCAICLSVPADAARRRITRLHPQPASHRAKRQAFQMTRSAEGMIFNAPAGNCLPITIRTGSPAGFRLTSESREPGERAGRAIIQPASINGCVTWAVSAPPVLPHSHPCGHRYGEGQKLFHKNQLLSVPRDTPIIGKIFPIVNSGLRERPHNQVAPAPSADNTGQESARHERKGRRRRKCLF